MNKQDFYFDLPEELIAQYPLACRSASRLLVYDKSTHKTAHDYFPSLTHFLAPGDLLVMNDSRVVPARLLGQKLTGGKIELLFERLIDKETFVAHVKASKAPKPGTIVTLEKGWQLEMIARDDDLFYWRANGGVYELLESIGHVPLPPYISRQDELLDKERYQTVYARHQGSIAAPTAGLHFDETVLQALDAAGINRAYLTLHVGAGTFRPVRSESIQQHKMHSEWFSVTQELCDKVNETRAAGHRVIAVGTTALRGLESAAQQGRLQPYEGDTAIFIYPGYTFQLCNGLITNFHLPESTLLMLVSAFIGHKEAMALYQLAIEHRYRFFSYGDACLLL